MITMEKKQCSHCLKRLPLDHFCKDRSRKDGIHTWCRGCANKQRDDWYKTTGYRYTDEYREKQKSAGRNLYENRKEYLKTYYDKNKHKISARRAVRNAIISGNLIKLGCAECESTKAQAHHHKGYEKNYWLDVVWLCNYHHRIAHHG